MYWFSWLTADRITAFSSIVVAIAAVLSFVLAVRSLRLNQKISINANRPMMMAEVLQPDYPQEPLRLMITNRGRSVAKNVRVAFDPDFAEIEYPLKLKDRGVYLQSAVKRVQTIFKDRIFTTWVPGQQVDVAYWLQPDEKLVKDGEIADSAEGIPARIFAIIEYDDELRNHYVESYELNVRSVLGNDFRTRRTTTGGQFNFEEQLSKDIQENSRMLGRISRKM